MKMVLNTVVFALAITSLIHTNTVQASCQNLQNCDSGAFVAARESKLPRSGADVAATIRELAPQYGVPTWFALRIAQVESHFNPAARGSAGEYGVYQLKCETAREIGFGGACKRLLNPTTNINYGLRHLALAIKKSGGNLKLAASKHNGGLGRTRLVASYVAAVF